MTNRGIFFFNPFGVPLLFVVVGGRLLLYAFYLGAFVQLRGFHSREILF